jgi:hypothetical protein
MDNEWIVERSLKVSILFKPLPSSRRYESYLLII